MEKFWYVYNPACKGPSRKHETLSGAIEEANRLAEIIPGKYYVLEPVCEVKTTYKGLEVKMTPFE